MKRLKVLKEGPLTAVRLYMIGSWHFYINQSHVIVVTVLEYYNKVFI